MSKSFHACDVTGFLDSSIGSYLSEIEAYAIDMANTEDAEERASILGDIQYIVEQCNNVLR